MRVAPFFSIANGEITLQPNLSTQSSQKSRTQTMKCSHLHFRSQLLPDQSLKPLFQLIGCFVGERNCTYVLGWE